MTEEEKSQLPIFGDIKPIIPIQNVEGWVPPNVDENGNIVIDDMPF